MKKTDKLTKKQVFAIPELLKKKSIRGVAMDYKVSWQAIFYHIKKLRENGIEVITRKQGHTSVIYK